MDNNTRDVYTANGVTTSFRFNFWIMLKEDITVYLGDVIQSSGFTVTGVLNPSGGEISFNTPPADGTVVTLVLTPVPERLVTYQQNGDLPPEVLNNDLDRLYLLALAVSTIVLRSLSLGFSDIDGQGAYRANGNRITGLGAPVDNSDAVRKADVVNLVKPYDDSARESAEAAAAWASDAAQSAVNSAFNAERAETAADAANFDANRAEAAADSIDPEVIEEQIESLAEYLSNHVIDANPHPYYHPPWNDVTGKPEFFAAKWGTGGTIDGYDPKKWVFEKVFDNPSSTSLSVDLRANYGDGDFLIRTASSASGYLITTNNENNAAMVGANNVHVGNIFVAGTAPNYIRAIYKKAKP